MYEFNDEKAKELQKEFSKVCEEFAEKHGIVFANSHLKYGESLSFSIKFTSKQNNDAEWLSMVNYFKNQGVNLVAGGEMIDKGSGAKYTITGELNPRKSKFRIGLASSSGKQSFGTVEWILNNLK